MKNIKKKPDRKVKGVDYKWSKQTKSFKNIKPGYADPPDDKPKPKTNKNEMKGQFKNLLGYYLQRGVVQRHRQKEYDKVNKKGGIKGIEYNVKKQRLATAKKNTKKQAKRYFKAQREARMKQGGGLKKFGGMIKGIFKRK